MIPHLEVWGWWGRSCGSALGGGGRGWGIGTVSYRYRILPVPHHDTVRDFVDFLSKLEHRPALVHCSEGEGRSVLFAALYRIHFEGWSNEQALDGTTRLPAELKFLGALFPSLADFDPVTVKGQYVLKYERVTPEKPGRPKKENKGQ